MSTFRVGDRVMAVCNISAAGSRSDSSGTSVRLGDLGTVVYVPSGEEIMFQGSSLHVRWDTPRSGMHNNVADGQEIRPANGYRVKAETLSLFERGKSVRKNSRFNKFVDKVEKVA